MLRHENTHTGIHIAYEKLNENFTYNTDLTSYIKKMHVTVTSATTMMERSVVV